MLCPEVWTFQPPSAVHNFKTGSFADDSKRVEDVIKHHYFNHLVSVVIPNVLPEPDVTSIFTEDSDYYVVKNISIGEFINYEFLEAFVRQGYLTVLSHKTLIDVDDCMCITPDGQLVLNLLRESYLELGLEGTPSVFSSGVPSRFVVKVDLKDSSFIPSKKNYQRVREKLENILHKFDVLLVWETPMKNNKNVCPSSVAAYLHGKGYSVALCKPTFSKWTTYYTKVPCLPVASDSKDKVVAENIVEWLGAYSLRADLEPDSQNVAKKNNRQFSFYETPSPNILCNNVLVLEWKGFFPSKKIAKLYSHLREFAGESQAKPWISLHVQGFADSPISWNNNEHSFFTDGDNHYTLFIQSHKYLMYQVKGSTGRPKNKTKINRKS